MWTVPFDIFQYGFNCRNIQDFFKNIDSRPLFKYPVSSFTSSKPDSEKYQLI